MEGEGEGGACLLQPEGGEEDPAELEEEVDLFLLNRFPVLRQQ